MSEEETFQGFSLILPARKQELWRWLYADLLGAVFDEPLQPRGPHVLYTQLGQAVFVGTVSRCSRQLQAQGYTRPAVSIGFGVPKDLPKV